MSILSSHHFWALLANTALIVYTLGWPYFLASVFYTGKVSHAFDDSKFARIFGFIYKRYEV